MHNLIRVSEEQLVTVKVVKSIYTVSIQSSDFSEEIDITGVSVLPQLIDIKPIDIRNLIINKVNADGGIEAIENSTKKGFYCVNIKDYSAIEIQYFVLSNINMESVFGILMIGGHRL